MKSWVLKRTKLHTAVMAQELQISEAAACMLANRGLADRQQARIFLQGALQEMRDASLMKDMTDGLCIIETAIKKKDKIAVYGDYDVDGVMSTTILYRTILKCGGEAIYYIPHRQQEGYGLNIAAVEALAAAGVKVLFTCDNGIAAIDEVARAKQLGMQIVLLDHHEPGFTENEGSRQDILPPADAIIDPKQRDCTYPFSLLCAGGISYKFAMALLQRFSIADAAFAKQLLCFAAIATVCDIVDLMDENRILVRCGLKELDDVQNVGLRVLMEEAGILDKRVTEYHLGFIIGPCINAVGRLQRADTAVRLFCEEDEDAARSIAQTLVALNEERKRLTQEAVKRVEAELADKPADRVMVLYDGDTHESIAGIVAGRIKEAFYRPVILITHAEDGAKGSGRSIPGYHMFEALFQCRDLFSRFGGHAMAAGLSLPTENIPLLRQRLNESCTLTEKDMIPVLRIEKILSFSEIDFSLANEIKALAPFGKENPTPLFASQNIFVDRLDLIGKNKDILKMTLRDAACGIRLSAISFDGYEQLQEILKELYPANECDKIETSGTLPQKMDFVYSIEINTYNGRSAIQLGIKDFRLSRE